VRLRALRKRKDWRKADLPRLLYIGVPPAGQRRIAKLLKSKSPGRGVVPPSKSFLEEIVDGWETMKGLADPATPPNIRRKLYEKTRWWPYFIEAAYRGELKKVKGGTAWHHRRASEFAEQEVAAAVGISASKVHQLCQQVRDWRGGAPAPADEPSTSATELKQYLEVGNDLVRERRISRTPRVKII
jgi:transcriptional regulator with XRE-family HTH domain